MLHKRISAAKESFRRQRLPDHAAERNERIVSAHEELSTGWFWETDADGLITYLSRNVLSLFAERQLDPIGKKFVTIFCPDRHGDDLPRSLSFNLTTKTAFTDFPITISEGQTTFLWSISGRPSCDTQGTFIGFTGFAVDLAEKRKSEAEIRRLAYSDGLTGLANRAMLSSWLAQSLGSRTSGL